MMLLNGKSLHTRCLTREISERQPCQLDSGERVLGTAMCDESTPILVVRESSRGRYNRRRTAATDRIVAEQAVKRCSSKAPQFGIHAL
jgi:hypothetical protein